MLRSAVLLARVPVSVRHYATAASAGAKVAKPAAAAAAKAKEAKPATTSKAGAAAATTAIASAGVGVVRSTASVLKRKSIIDKEAPLPEGVVWAGNDQLNVGEASKQMIAQVVDVFEKTVPLRALNVQKTIPPIFASITSDADASIALAALSRLRHRDATITIETSDILINTLVQVHQLDACMTILKNRVDYGVFPTLAGFHALANGYLAANKIRQAVQVFDLLPFFSHVPTVETLEIVAKALAQLSEPYIKGWKKLARLAAQLPGDARAEELSKLAVEKSVPVLQEDQNKEKVVE